MIWQDSACWRYKNEVVFNMENSYTIYKTPVPELFIKWLTVVIVSGLLLFVFLKAINFSFIVIWLCIWGVSGFFSFLSHCLIFINQTSGQVVIQDGHFFWSNTIVIAVNSIEEIIVAYDTLDRDHDLIPYKPFFVDLIDEDNKAFTVYRTKLQSTGQKKAAEIAHVLGKKMKDYSNFENMVYYKIRAFLVR